MKWLLSERKDRSLTRIQVAVISVCMLGYNRRAWKAKTELVEEAG